MSLADETRHPEAFMDYLMDETGCNYGTALDQAAEQFDIHDLVGLDESYMLCVQEVMDEMPEFDDYDRARERYRTEQLKTHGMNTDLWDPEPDSPDVLEQHFEEFKAKGSQHFEDHIDDTEEYDDA